MDKFKNILVLVGFFLVLITPSTASAATFYSGEQISIDESQKNLSDLYLFGSQINLSSPVKNDVVAAGGDINIDKAVSGGIIVAGGNIQISASVDGSVRIAGGNIVIDGPIKRDLVVIGGSLKTTKDASIGGDLVFTGGSLNVLGPVSGHITANSESVNLENKIGGGVNGEIGQIYISDNVVINGDLRYKSGERAKIADQAIIRGETSFQRIETTEKTGRSVGKVVNAGSSYKLITDILFSLFFILIIPVFLINTTKSIRATPLKSGLIGIVTIFMLPVLSLLLLLAIWFGIFSFLMYFMLLVISMVVANLFVGELAMKWWNKRDKKDYILDWKAGVVGPFILYLVWFIPVIGWITTFVVYLMSLGGVVSILSSIVKSQNIIKSK